VTLVRSGVAYVNVTPVVVVMPPTVISTLGFKFVYRSAIGLGVKHVISISDTLKEEKEKKKKNESWNGEKIIFVSECEGLATPKKKMRG